MSRDAVGRAAGKFRVIFGAEAEVEVIKVEGDSAVVKFGGNMCYTCGTYDYFEDFAYMIGDELGEEWSVASYSQTDEGEYIVEFKPKRLVARTRRHVRVVLNGEPLDFFA